MASFDLEVFISVAKVVRQELELQSMWEFFILYTSLFSALVVRGAE